MTLQEFKALDKIRQADTLLKCGVMLTEIRNKNYKLFLYQIDGFYVEVWYEVKAKRIIQYRSFIGVDQLAPYLNKVDITGVYSF